MTALPSPDVGSYLIKAVRFANERAGEGQPRLPASGEGAGQDRWIDKPGAAQHDARPVTIIADGRGDDPSHGLVGFERRVLGDVADPQALAPRADALVGHLDAGEDLLLLDVRKPEEFTGELGHIEGARNLPLDSLNERIEELAAWQERPVMLVCHTDKRSAKAARILARKGFARLHVVAGGMVAWNAAGLPTRNRHPRPGE